MDRRSFNLNQNLTYIPFGSSVWVPIISWVSNATPTGRWERVGGCMNLNLRIDLGGAPTSTPLTFELPNNQVLDENIVTFADNDFPFISVVKVKDAAPADYMGSVSMVASDPNTLAVFISLADGTNLQEGNQVSETNPITFANNDRVTIACWGIPIAGWS